MTQTGSNRPGISAAQCRTSTPFRSSRFPVLMVEFDPASMGEAMKRREFITVLGPAAIVVTPAQADLVRKSFDEMGSIRRNFAVKFYNRFFEVMPDARSLFPDDMEKQYLKLMDTIAALVGALDNDALFQSIIGHTARQHARFGVTSSQLAAFGDALIWTLEQQFSSAFTPELKQAWVALYEAMQTEMISAGAIQA